MLVYLMYVWDNPQKVYSTEITNLSQFRGSTKCYSLDCEDSDSLLYKAWPSLQVPSGIVNDLENSLPYGGLLKLILTGT